MGHCASSRHPQPYPNLKEAADACLKLGSTCTGVYDSGCNNVGSFYLCKPGRDLSASSISCVHTPQAVGGPTKPAGTTKAAVTTKPAGTTAKDTTKYVWTKVEKKHCASSRHPQPYPNL